MAKNNTKRGKRDIKRRARIKNTAELTGVSERTVERTLAGEGKKTNEKVMTVYMELKEGETRLIQEVQKLVPFL